MPPKPRYISDENRTVREIGERRHHALPTVTAKHGHAGEYDAKVVSIVYRRARLVELLKRVRIIQRTVHIYCLQLLLQYPCNTNNKAKTVQRSCFECGVYVYVICAISVTPTTNHRSSIIDHHSGSHKMAEPELNSQMLHGTSDYVKKEVNVK
ncbi:hypothetical protein BDR06DRAFT_115538 [Suillus hirtellus]|nr:hypothetical protein BDR06DRAFT_115538 [Suillus hirtellus]